MKTRFTTLAVVTLDLCCVIVFADTNELWRHAVPSYAAKDKSISAVCAEVEQLSRHADPSGRGLTIQMFGPDDHTGIADKDLAIAGRMAIVLSPHDLPHRMTRLTIARDAFCIDSQSGIPLEVPLRCHTSMGGDVIAKPEGRGRYILIVDYPVQTYQMGDNWYFRPFSSEESMFVTADGYHTNRVAVEMMPYSSPGRPPIRFALEPIRK
jgi:hypothetical protein